MEQESQPIQLLDATRRLFATAEQLSQRPIVIEPTADSSSRAMFSRGRGNHPDRIRYRPALAEHIDHLVAHEVGHVLFRQSFPAAERLDPSVNLAAVHADIGEEAMTLFNWLAPEAFKTWEQNTANILISTFVSLPEDVQIEQMIAGEPELVIPQRASLAQQASELLNFMRDQPRRNLPAKVRGAAAAMEGAWTFWLSRFLQDSHYEAPYLEAGYGDLVSACFEDLAELPFDCSLRDCREATDKMAERVGIRSWYGWRR